MNCASGPRQHDPLIVLRINMPSHARSTYGIDTELLAVPTGPLLLGDMNVGITAKHLEVGEYRLFIPTLFV